MRVFDNVEELESAVGQELGRSSWLEITQERIDVFGDVTEDRNWIHSDVDRAS